MKKALSLLLCALMLVSCLALGAYANEETTDEQAAPVERTNDRLVFDLDLISKPNPIGGNNGLNKSSGVSKKGEWEGYKINIKYPEDPNFTINYQTYFKKYDLTPLTGEEVSYIVLRFVVPEDGYYDDFEIYHCAGTVTAPTEDAKATSEYCDEANGFTYFIFNLEGAWEGEISQLRIDPIGMDEGDVIYLMEIAMFKTEEDAYNWCAFEEEEETTTEEQTEEPTTAEVTTEEQTTKPESIRPKDEKKGCGSVIGIGAVVAMISLGIVCIKKKD